MKVILRVEQGLDRKRNFVITRNTLLGRSTCCDLRIDSNDISRRHCFLLVTAEGIWVRDLSSANGTIVDNRRLAEGEECLLHPGAMISVGPVDFSVHFQLQNQPAVAQVGPGQQTALNTLETPDVHVGSLPNYLDSDHIQADSNRLQESFDHSYQPREMSPSSSCRIDQVDQSVDDEGSRLMTFFSHLVGWKKSDNK